MTMNGLDFGLLKRARLHVKMGFVPSDGAAGGGPPPPGGDPGGGMPPPPGGDPGAGGPPPPGGDPGAGGPPPPPPPGDLSAGGAPPDAAGSAPPPGGDIAAQVAMGVQQAMQQTGLQGNGKPTAPKADINTIATDVFQLKKMFFHVCRINGWELPPDILDGPNRDPQTGAPAMGPTGGSDAQPGSSAQQAGGGAQSAIKPIQPMAGAFPSGGGAGGGGMGALSKTSSDRSIGRGITSDRVMSQAAATAMLLHRQRLIRT